MLKYYILFLILGCFISKCSSEDIWKSLVREVAMKTFIFWPNASVPFYIDPDHFDHDQRLEIRRALAQIEFKTCIKFAPVLAAPTADQHVMTFLNPEGIKRCKIELQGHANDKPHAIVLGYECLKPPEIFMIILRALGLPFEHNRMRRDEHIEVKMQNIEPHYIPLFTKDNILPPKLERVTYDINSVMHFGERDYSKNGHKTIVFKGNKSQNRYGLTTKDVTKLDLIYAPECRKRDRAEKVEICQSYPGVGRRKREIIEPPGYRSLRVNPNITPPPHILAGITENANPERLQETATDAEDSLKILGIESEAEKIVEIVYQISALALRKANDKYCNISSNTTSEFEFNYEKSKNKHTSDVLGVLQILAEFAKTIVDNAVENPTEFCQNSQTIEDYQRQCKSGNDRRCPRMFKSECLTTDFVLQLVDKSKDNENDKNKTNNVITTTLKPNRRRKREAVDAVTTPKSEEKTTEKDKEENNEVHKDTVKLMKEDRLKEIQKAVSTTKSELVSSKTVSKVKEEKKEPLSRKFRDKRYKVQDRQDVSDWEDSDTSLDKKNLEPERSLKNKKLLQQVLAEGASAILKKEKEAEKEGEIESESVEKKEKTAEYTDADTEEDPKDEEADKVPLEEIDVDMDEEPQQRNRERTRKPGKVPKTVKLSKLNTEFYHERKWPDGDVIYVIDKLEEFDLGDVRKRLAEVNNILVEKTCVKIREVDAKEAPGFDNYVILDASPDYVTGKVGGKQNFGCIELFEGGQHKQHAAMVVMAMLGFYFEVSRHDRDKYIRVHNRHIRADKLHHFEKINEEATLKIPYDFKSATHPSWQFWRRVGKKGISTIATFKEQDPDGSIMRGLGQNPELLSDSDILKINSVYGVECFQSNRASNNDKKEIERMNEEKVIQ